MMTESAGQESKHEVSKPQNGSDFQGESPAGGILTHFYRMLAWAIPNRGIPGNAGSEVADAIRAGRTAGSCRHFFMYFARGVS